MKRRSTFVVAVFVWLAGLAKADNVNRAILDDLPINGNATVTMVIGKNKEATRVNSSACTNVTKDVPGVVFSNNSDSPIRVTLQNGGPACKGTCSTDAAKYAKNLCSDADFKKGICTQTMDICLESDVERGTCTPNPQTMAICGGPECEQIRKECKKAGCKVDFYSAIEACGCSVSKTVLAGKTVIFEPSLFPWDPSAKGPQSQSVTFVFHGEKDAGGTPSTLTYTLQSTPSAACMQPNAGGPRMHVAVVPIDSTGVASWVYTNPRRPACIDCDPNAAVVSAGVAFRNRTFDQTFAVSLTLPASAPLPPTFATSFKCTQGTECTIARSVAPLSVILFDSSLLSAFDGVIPFSVSILGSATPPANATAYLIRQPPPAGTTLPERAPGTKTTTTISLSGSLDPSLPVPPATPTPPATLDTTKFTPCQKSPTYDQALEPVLCGKHPYGGPTTGGSTFGGTNGVTRQYKATGSIQFAPNLGDRADGSASFTFRSGSYGGTIDKIALDQYYATIYGTNAMTLKLGKTKFASPTNAIVINESGEGFQYSYHQFSLGHLVSRESDAGVADTPNRDKKDWFLQAKSLSLWGRLRAQQRQFEAEREQAQSKSKGTESDTRDTRPNTKPTLSIGRFNQFLTHFHTLDLIAMRGEDKALRDHYWSTGGELFFGWQGRQGPASDGKALSAILHSWGGSAAVYRSHREFRANAPCAVTTPATCNDASGTAALISITYTPEIDIQTANLTTSTTPHTVGLTIGRGSRDRSEGVDTPYIRGYIGDKAAVSSVDQLFFASILPSLNSTKVQYATPGLLNKEFATFHYTNNRWSLLNSIARILKVTDDVNSRTTSFTYTSTRLLAPRNGSRVAGNEADVAFNIEVPKGVTFSLGAAYLTPGAAYSEVLLKRVWSAAAGVSLSF